jgi:hypothetical protein
MSDSSKLPIVALVDSGCSRSSIDELFVQENKITIYNLLITIPVYNVDGTPNRNRLISKFITVELLIEDHSKRLGVFLRYNWLKEHNLVINWKKKHTIEFTCADEHLPTLIPEDDKDDHVGYEKEEERLFHIDIDSYIQATSTELAAEAHKSKQPQTFEDVVPHHYHQFKDVFDKESFDELPPRQLWDYTIELLPGDHEINCKMYNLMLD